MLGSGNDCGKQNDNSVQKQSAKPKSHQGKSILIYIIMSIALSKIKRKKLCLYFSKKLAIIIDFSPLMTLKQAPLSFLLKNILCIHKCTILNRFRMQTKFIFQANRKRLAAGLHLNSFRHIINDAIYAKNKINATKNKKVCPPKCPKYFFILHFLLFYSPIINNQNRSYYNKNQ